LSAKARARKAPASLRSSIEFRHYLAERDVFVRQSQQGLKSAINFAQALTRGRQAARTMWNQTRDNRVSSPNERIVNSDMRRFQTISRHQPAEPGWQFCYAVWNFAPAAQLVGVEQQDADGSWRIIQACHTIEFQTRAATPRSDIIREHAAPVKWDGDHTNPPRLRVFCRGIGEVKIGALELIARDIRYHAKGRRKGWRTLGRKAPEAGWPDFTTDARTAMMEVSFAYAAVHKKRSGADAPDLRIKKRKPASV
jgi:hypothetical protein